MKAPPDNVLSALMHQFRGRLLYEPKSEGLDLVDQRSIGGVLGRVCGTVRGLQYVLLPESMRKVATPMAVRRLYFATVMGFKNAP